MAYYPKPALHSELRITLNQQSGNNITIRDENIVNAKAILNVDRTSATLPESSFTFSIISPTETIKNFVRGMKPGNFVNLSISQNFNTGDNKTPMFKSFGVWFLKKYEITQDIINITCMDVIGMVDANGSGTVWLLHGQYDFYEMIQMIVRDAAPDLGGVEFINPHHSTTYGQYDTYKQLYGRLTGSKREMLRQILQACTLFYVPGPILWNNPTVAGIRRKRFGSLSNLDISSIYDLYYTTDYEVEYFPQTEQRYIDESVLLDDVTYTHTIGSPTDIFGRVRVKYNVETLWDGSDFTQTFTDDQISGPFVMPYHDTEIKWENINLSVCTGRETGSGATRAFQPLPATSGDASVLDTHVYLNQIFSHHVTAQFTLISDPYNDIYKNGYLKPLSPVYVLLDQENSQNPMYVFPKTYSVNLSDGLKVQIDGGAIPINGPVPGWNPPTP